MSEEKAPYHLPVSEETTLRDESLDTMTASTHLTLTIQQAYNAGKFDLDTYNRLFDAARAVDVQARKLSDHLEREGRYTTSQEHARVEAIPPEARSGYHTYSIHSRYDGEVVEVTVQGLLQIADFVAAQRERLEELADMDDGRKRDRNLGPHSPESPNYDVFDDDL